MSKRLVLLAILVGSTVGLIAQAGATAPATGGAGAFSKTETITREFLVNGAEQVVDTRTVTLKVSQTVNLRGRQEIKVSWSGAHPTGGIVANQKFDRGPARGVPVRPAGVPWRRFDKRECRRPAQPGDMLDAELE